MYIKATGCPISMFIVTPVIHNFIVAHRSSEYMEHIHVIQKYVCMSVCGKATCLLLRLDPMIYAFSFGRMR